VKQRDDLRQMPSRPVLLPTKTGIQHPATIGRDLLGEMIEALHPEGIRCPILIQRSDGRRTWPIVFPQWRQMRRDGTFAEVENSADGVTIQPGPVEV